MAKIKICGLKSLDDICYVNEAGIDFAGFIFASKSKRCIDKKLAQCMKQALNKDIKSVGVFVNEEINIIKDIAEQKIIDLIQLHGNETNEYIKELHIETNLPVIKAFKADEKLNKNMENTFADYVLIDSNDGNKFGGTGKTFDYKIIPKTNKLIFLAGGLNANNIKNAIKINPYCFDINSGVEINGKKNKNKILEIVKIIRNYVTL
mgnify:CR=1 FL=1